MVIGHFSNSKLKHYVMKFKNFEGLENWSILFLPVRQGYSGIHFFEQQKSL